MDYKFKVLDDNSYGLINSVKLMTKKILPLLMMLTFAIGIIAEADLFHGNEESIEKVTSVSNMEAPTLSDLGDNCEDKDCHDTKRHCSHHCSGVHNVTAIYNIIKISSSFGQDSKTIWYYFTQYQIPNIDSALRPPTLLV